MHFESFIMGFIYNDYYARDSNLTFINSANRAAE